MFKNIFSIGLVALCGFGAVNASPVVNAACPATSVITTSYTGLILAPHTTYPYTTTVTYTSVSYPVASETLTETYTYNGVEWLTAPFPTTVTTSFVSTYTETETFVNYYGPFPDC